MFASFKEKLADSQRNTDSYIEFIGEIIEEEMERYHATDVLIEGWDRISRNQFRKMWKNMQIFGPLWKHPNF